MKDALTLWDYQNLTSQAATLERLLERIPQDQVINRMSYQRRLDQIRERLKNATVQDNPRHRQSRIL